MGIEYYAFALFIAALVCLAAILFKVLFANVKRQNKMLDEKESKLLQLYRSFESIIEEFNEQVTAAMEDIQEYERRAAEHAAQAAAAYIPSPPPPLPPPAPIPVYKEEPERPQRASMTVDSTRIRAASEVLERAERMVKSVPDKNAAHARSGGGVIQRIFDDATTGVQVSTTELPSKYARKEAIIALAEEGKTEAQIARELGITRNEVKLVIDLIRQK